MSVDSRTPHTDALATLGTVIGPGEARDAIHLAVEPVIAGETLRPGDHVGLKDGYAQKNARPLLGIVDPFLDNPVIIGDRFWLIIYPRRITSLRHVWEHPDIPSTPVDPKPSDDLESDRKKARARMAIEMIADGLGVDPDELIRHAGRYVADRKRGGWGDYWIEGDRFEGVVLPDMFWPHYETLTGETVEEAHRGSIFSCSC